MTSKKITSDHEHGKRIQKAIFWRCRREGSWLLWGERDIHNQKGCRASLGPVIKLGFCSRRGGYQRDVGPDTGAEAQLRETFCAEEMEGGKKDSLISPLGGAVKPWLPHYSSSLHPCPPADPLLPCPRGIHGTQQAAPGLWRRQGEVPGQGLVPSMHQDMSSPQGDSEPRWHAPHACCHWRALIGPACAAR